jgi:hypothetical protein
MREDMTSVPTTVVASHCVTIELPVRPCQRLFTPAGEELWVDGWQPRYLHPENGRTVQGMLFTTGSAEEMTVWVLTEFSQDPYRARYARVTPASRWGFVEVVCVPLGDELTQVFVTYQMHALNAAGATLLKDFEPEPFAAMIDHWKACIDQRLDVLRCAVIR